MNNSFAVAQLVILEMHRRKDFYVLFFLTVLITGLMGSVNFFNDPKVARYLKEICLALIWVCGAFIAIATTARQIPAEHESRTIFPLMAKPITRGQGCSANSSVAGSRPAPVSWRSICSSG